MSDLVNRGHYVVKGELEGELDDNRMLFLAIARHDFGTQIRSNNK